MHDTIHTLIHQSDSPALIDLAAGWELSGTDLRAAVDRLAGQLAAAGAGPGDGVGIAMPNSGATLLAFLAAARAGAIAMPVNPQLREHEIAAGFEDRPPAAIVVGEDGHAAAEAVGRSAGIALHVLSAGPRPALAGAPERAPAPPAPDPDAVALLLHTSGTTSRPKAVPLRQRNIAASARTIATAYELGPGDRSYCLMPLFHIHGLVASTLLSALTGATMAQLCGFAETRALAGAMMEELLTLADALGCEPRVSIERRLEGAAAVGDHKTSMLQDLESGRRLELDVLSTAVLELGELTGVELPMIRAVHAATALLDQMRRPS